MQGASDRNNILICHDITKAYGGKSVLEDIDLIVSTGELCTVVGPSGCGKSTLLRLILGQERPTSGKLLTKGEAIGSPNPRRGIVYQRYSLFPNLTVLENVMIGKRLSSGFFGTWRSGKAFLEETMYFLEKMRLAEHGNKYPSELSGGMQQRVAIAQSLIMRPSILLMDEPFGALDPGTREEMQVFLLELWEEFAMTIFFVTHDLEEAVFLGTRILVLSQFYSCGKGNRIGRGARIVADYPLQRRAATTAIKATAEFGSLIQQIRREGFEPTYLQHVTQFNLRHADSTQSLTDEDRGATVL